MNIYPWQLQIIPVGGPRRYRVPVGVTVPHIFGNLNDRSYNLDYETDSAKPFYIKLTRISTGTVM